MRDLSAAGTPVLSAAGITHRYGGVLALKDVSLDIPEGAFVAILGSNGAGKSTFGMILSAMLRPTAGQVRYAGTPVIGGRGLAARGVCLIPEGRRLFGQLTVAENLHLGGYGAGCANAELPRRMGKVLELLPQAVRDNVRRAAATLSGGEQQMLAIGRALMAEPKVLIIDEPSMGLAPILVDRVYSVLADLHARGVTIVLIEQIATRAVQHADTIVVLDRGTVIYSGPAKGAAADSALKAGYIGESGRGAKRA